jgi:hypothetical protein
VEVFPRRRGARSDRVTTVMGYVMIYLIGFVAIAIATHGISRGWLRAVTYALLLGFVWVLTAWILVGKPTTKALALSSESLAWVDQRLRKDSMRRDAIARIEQRMFRAPLGTRTGAWVVDVTGRARVKLVPRFPAGELAEGLGVPLVEAQGLARNQRELERLLPGSGEMAMRHALIQCVIPVGLGVAALVLDATL